MNKWLIIVALAMLALPAGAAEYKGSNIDGESYDCTGYSFDTSKYYSGTCEFRGDEITLVFSNGKSITVTLDDEEIEDPDDIEAFDFSKGTFWQFEVELDD